MHFIFTKNKKITQIQPSLKTNSTVLHLKPLMPFKHPPVSLKNAITHSISIVNLVKLEYSCPSPTNELKIHQVILEICLKPLDALTRTR